MEGQGRNLGLIAIAIGLLALGVAIGSRTSAPVYAPPGYYQQAPSSQQAPGYQQEQPSDVGPRGGYAEGFGPHGRPGRHMPFFAPFFFIGGLIKFLLFGLLLFGLLRFFRGRRPHGGPPWGQGGPGGHDSRKPGDGETPAPEQPTAYTGGTTRL